MSKTKFAHYFDTLKVSWRKLIQPLAIAIGKRVSANTVTTIRMLISFVIPVFSFFAMANAALATFAASSVGDALDGAVSEERKKLGFSGDQKFGQFYDPFCDKVVWLFNNIIHMVWYPHYLYGQYWPVAFALIGISLVMVEGTLMLVRVVDYNYECVRGDSSRCERALSATNNGKFKQIMECVGLGAIIFSFSGNNTWAFYVATVSYALALPFAVKSLTEKIRARRA